MKIETYKCDVCKNVIELDCIFKISPNITVVKYRPGFYGKVTKEEMHICYSCIEKITPDFAKELVDPMTGQVDFGRELIDLISEVAIAAVEDR